MPAAGAQVGKGRGGAPGSACRGREGREAVRGCSRIPFLQFFWGKTAALEFQNRPLALGVQPLLRRAEVVGSRDGQGGEGGPGWEAGARPRRWGEGWRPEPATPHFGATLPAFLRCGGERGARARMQPWKDRRESLEYIPLGGSAENSGERN